MFIIIKIVTTRFTINGTDLYKRTHTIGLRPMPYIPEPTTRVQYRDPNASQVNIYTRQNETSPVTSQIHYGSEIFMIKYI